MAEPDIALERSPSRRPCTGHVAGHSDRAISEPLLIADRTFVPANPPPPGVREPAGKMPAGKMIVPRCKRIVSDCPFMCAHAPNPGEELANAVH